MMATVTNPNNSEELKRSSCEEKKIRLDDDISSNSIDGGVESSKVESGFVFLVGGGRRITW